jgi:hypothetical protein
MTQINAKSKYRTVQPIESSISGGFIVKLEMEFAILKLTPFVLAIVVFELKPVAFRVGIVNPSGSKIAANLCIGSHPRFL